MKTSKPELASQETTRSVFTGSGMPNRHRQTLRPLDRLLAQLRGVRRAGAGWRADCPNGHTKTRGTLAIVEADDGRLLLKCFACSDTQGILSAIGLGLVDLFPDRLCDPSPESRRATRETFHRMAWTAALGVLAREASIVLVACRMLRRAEPLSEADHARLAEAESRIAQARELLHGR